MICVRSCASFGENPTNEWTLRNYSQLNSTDFHSLWFVCFSFGLFLLNDWILTCLESRSITQMTKPNWRFTQSLLAFDLLWLFTVTETFDQLIEIMWISSYCATHNYVCFISGASQSQRLEEVTSKGEILLYLIILSIVLIDTNFNDF